jgi:hypothetical protein
MVESTNRKCVEERRGWTLQREGVPAQPIAFLSLPRPPPARRDFQIGRSGDVQSEGRTLRWVLNGRHPGGCVVSSPQLVAREAGPFARNRYRPGDLERQLGAGGENVRQLDTHMIAGAAKRQHPRRAGNLRDAQVLRVECDHAGCTSNAQAQLTFSRE